MKQRRLKIIVASVILLVAMAFLVVAGIRSTSVRHFTPAVLVANANAVDNQKVQGRWHYFGGKFQMGRG